MSEKLRAWQNLSEALDALIGNAQEISEYLATRHPEEGGILVYTPLEQMLTTRDEAISTVRSLREGLVPLTVPEDDAEKSVRAGVDGKITELLDLEKKNNARLNELGDFYKEKLKSNKQARETITAYTQQVQAVAEMNTGTLFNQAN